MAICKTFFSHWNELVQQNELICIWIISFSQELIKSNLCLIGFDFPGYFIIASIFSSFLASMIVQMEASSYLRVLQILLPVFRKVPAAMDCIFRNLYGKLYLHQYLIVAEARPDQTRIFHQDMILRHRLKLSCNLFKGLGDELILLPCHHLSVVPLVEQFCG